MTTNVTAYSVREFKAKLSEILRNLDDGEEVIVTRRGKPCARFTPIPSPAEKKLPLSALRDLLPPMPDLSYQDFLDIKKIWEPRMPPDEEDAASKC